MLASEQSVPPNQIGRRRIRSLTTIYNDLIDADRFGAWRAGAC
jgi:hypothetical protein